MKIFLTGISGFLGSHVAEILASQGHEIFALVRNARRGGSRTAPTKLDFQAIQGTLPDCDNLIPILSQVDAVIHIAGKVKALSQKEFHETNALGTQKLVEACLKASSSPKTFLYVSTIAVLNPAKDGSDYCIPPEQCHPLSWYGQSKLEGEKSLKILNSKMKTITLRPPILYGPRDEEMFALFKTAKLGFAPLYGNGSNQLSLCYVKDVAHCIVDLVAHPPHPHHEIYCLDDGKIHTWRSLIENVADSLNKKIYLFPIPSFLFPFGALMTEFYAKLSSKPHIFTRNKIKEMSQKAWVCGHEKLAKTRGWKPQTSFQEGVKLAYHFYKQEGWL